MKTRVFFTACLFVACHVHAASWTQQSVASETYDIVGQPRPRFSRRLATNTTCTPGRQDKGEGDGISCGDYDHYKVCQLTPDSPATCKKNVTDHCHYSCVACTDSSQCSDPSDACDTEKGSKTNGECTMKPLFAPFDTRDIAVTAAISVGAMLAAGGGLGGGGIFVPCYIIIMGLHAKEASALSQGTIFGGSIVNLVMNSRQHHPLKYWRPLTDYPTILIFEPLLLGGTVLGVMLNVMCPEWLILACLMLVLLYAVVRTGRKGIRTYKQENEKRALDTAARGITSSAPPLTDVQDGVQTEQGVGSPRDKACRRDEVLEPGSPPRTMLEVEMVRSPLRRRTPARCRRKEESTPLKGVPDDRSSVAQLEEEDWIKDQESAYGFPLALILIVWIIVSAFNLLRGGKGGSKSIIPNLETCDAGWWALTAGMFPVLFGITIVVGLRQVKKFKLKQDSGWQPCEGDIVWDKRKLVIYPAIAAIAGILGGLLGIGGGMIISPLLLELGVLPRVASSTSAMAVLVTSSSATFQFLLLGMLQWDYFGFYAGVGIVGTFLGQTVIDYIIKKYNRTSIIIFSVATVILAAVFLMGYDGLNTILKGDARTSFDVVALCGAAKK